LKILLVEDDPQTSDHLAQGLREDGQRVDIVSDGREGFLRATGEPWDLLIVDRMVPGLDGLDMVRMIRASGITAPVLFLTTLGGIDDRVMGLEAGGDDYLVKPFAFAELIARVHALGRRPWQATRETRLRVADLELDLLSRTTQRGGRGIDLQPREFRLLEYLMRHAGQTVTRTMLLENVWDFHFDPHTNVVETHISRLRGKVDKGFAPELIHTIRGTGYSLRAPS
jgi:two-component system, OmpR family, response regulator